MNKRKTTALILLSIALGLSVIFLLNIEFPEGFAGYFKRAYYNQFGPLALSVELLIAGYYLFKADKNANFTLVLFGFTALLDPLFNVIGLFNSIVPLYATIVLAVCGIFCLRFAFVNTFKLKPLSPLLTLAGVVLAVLVELFFNYI